MKAAKVMIAAAVVALMFLAVPFASVASDAAWAPNTEEAVYYESDPAKLTWSIYKEVGGTTDDKFGNQIMQMSGFNVSDNTFSFTGMEVTNIELKGGRSAALVDSSLTKTSVTVNSMEFKFTATVTAVSGKIFTSALMAEAGDLVEYLALDEGKLKVGDKLEISGTIYLDTGMKTVMKYKDISETETALYYDEGDNFTDIKMSESVKLISGNTEKNYDVSLTTSMRNQQTISYEMDDDETYASKDGYYQKTNEKSSLQNGVFTYKFNDNECEITPTNIVSGGTSSTSEKLTDIVPISDVTFPTGYATYKSWLSESPLTEAAIKTKLGPTGTLSEDYFSVDDLFESIFNPTEEEKSVNQVMFFGAFIIILVIAIAIAFVYREKNRE